MALVNEHFLKLPDNYLFSDITKKINTFNVTHPKREIIRLDFEDITESLPKASIKAMHKALDEMENSNTFHEYIPEHGYNFLIEAIIKNDYLHRGISIDNSEVFINDGVKSDIGNIEQILRHDNSIGVTDPISPRFIASNVISGRAGAFENGSWSNVVYMPCNIENGFIPSIPNKRVDVIYLSYPNNPTGTVLSKKELKNWVNYAIENDTLILFDSTYHAYIQDTDIPHSIYEIKGAKKVAIEFRSFYKSAGNSGVRCGYTIIPHELTLSTLNNERLNINRLWSKHQGIEFNGASYITQRAAQALYSKEGKEEIKNNIEYYMTNAKIMKEGLTQCGFWVFGGDNSPYLWVKGDNETTSWKLFEEMLYKANVAATPGVGFGPSGEGFLRLTALADREICKEAIRRIGN